MSASAAGAVGPGPGPEAEPHVRAASSEDVPGIVTAVRDLLVELGSQPPDTFAMSQAARTLMDPRQGAVFVARAGEDHDIVVGVLLASYQTAMHVPGRYVLIQDLWVHSSWRGQALGRRLLNMLFELAHAQGITRAEVGLPRETFEGIDATELFYRHNGFDPLGPRMRRISS
jgi:GNAT superfamily N-acetyltransferase